MDKLDNFPAVPTTPANEEVDSFSAAPLQQEDQDGLEVDEGPEGAILNPFDPSLIRMELWNPTISLLVQRIKLKEIDLTPEFQRNAEIWSKKAQSRLIESLLVRIPLPAFYMDATDEDHFLVVDGLQRLTTLKNFVIEGTLSLDELEFLTEHNGKKFLELPRKLQRRIEETQVTVYRIEHGSPEDVKFNIFRRINTGGMPLSSQEIRHALNQGPVIAFLKELALCKEFLRATANGINDKRMAARETVLRFLAFAITPSEEYESKDMDLFLHEKMKALNRMTEAERADLARRFRRVMNVAFDLFGTDAFRKRVRSQSSRKPINKALFEAWAVNLDTLSEDQLSKLVERKNDVRERFMDLMDDRAFEASVSSGTGDPQRVRVRFSRIRQLLQEILA